jgi:hypothetical protein
MINRRETETKRERDMINRGEAETKRERERDMINGEAETKIEI